MTAGNALVGIVGMLLMALAAMSLHSLQMRLERWANHRH